VVLFWFISRRLPGGIFYEGTLTMSSLLQSDIEMETTLNILVISSETSMQMLGRENPNSNTNIYKHISRCFCSFSFYKTQCQDVKQIDLLPRQKPQVSFLPLLWNPLENGCPRLSLH